MGYSKNGASLLALAGIFLISFSCFKQQVDGSGKFPSQQRQQYGQQLQHHYNKQLQQHYNYKQQIRYQQQQQQQQQQQIQQRYYNKKYPNYYPQNYYNQKYYNKYKQKKYKYIKWPKTRGRCLYSPWKINGKNPVIEESKKGNMVVLFMLKSSDPFSYDNMKRLNDLAGFYSSIGRNITVMALNHRSRSLPAIYKTQFKNIKIYDEPDEKNIYALLRARYRQIIIYDKCGRQQYHFGYPYSWLAYPWVKLAVENARRFHEDYALCGRCKEYNPPTTANTSPTKANANTTTTTTTLKPTDRTVDGPYTNIQVAARNL